MAQFAKAEEEWSRPDLPSKCKYELGMPLKNSPHQHLGKVERPKLLPDILHYIHNTPVVQLNKIPKSEGVNCQVYAKCEFFNPGGSIKDRIALRMVEDAEKSGKLKPGYTIIEPTSGNTGIGLSMVAAVKGYKCVIVMPEKMSKEKVDIMTALGSEIIRTPTGAAFDDPGSNIRIAEKLVKEIPNSIVLNQYKNPANPLAHYDHTAEEILDAFDGKLDMVVCTAGTGGTITGVARKIKEKCPSCKIIGVDPIGSILAQPPSLNDTDITFYEVEGIGYDFLPTVFERKYVDKWYKCEDKPAFAMARRLMKEEGLLCGGSSGSATYCALKAAKDFNLRPDQKLVVLLPDSIRNYMTKFLSDDWLKLRSLYEGPESINDQKWKNTKIRTALTLPEASIFTPETTIRTAVETMKTGNHDFAVVSTEDLILGTVTSKILLDSITKNSGDDPISSVMIAHYNVLNCDDTLGQLSILLETDSHVLILKKDSHPKKTASKRLLRSIRKSLYNILKNPENVRGYAKCTHLANYLANHMPKK